MSIPKIIHYCWFGGSEIPLNDRKCMESWKKYCPDYEIIQWDENNYDVTQIPYTKEAFESERWAFVSDYARLDVLYRYGGIYLDTDVELVRSLDDLLELKGFSGLEKRTYHFNSGLGMGAIKGHPLLSELLQLYFKKHFCLDNGNSDLTPTPQIVTDYLQMKYPGVLTPHDICDIGDFRVFPPEYFCPQDYETGKTVITDNTYSIHHYHASWKTEEEKAYLEEYRRYTKLFGAHYGELVLQFVKATRTDGINQAVKKTVGYLLQKDNQIFRK